MIRVMIENLLLFLLPAVLYLGYRLATRKRGDADTSDTTTTGGHTVRQEINDAPFLWLFVAGAGLVLATLIAFGSTSGGKPGQTYYPPVVKDGVRIPGHFK